MRVVSLVPSATETLLALGVVPVGCTRFCEQPGIPTVGGTKDPDVQAVEELTPHLVVMNDEENRREDAEYFEQLGLSVYSMSPRSLEEVGAAVYDLAGAVDVEVPDLFTEPAWSDLLARHRRERVGWKAFVPVWPRPWMAMNANTYGSSVLAWLGVENVYGDSAERYPEIDVDDAVARRPHLVLLPTEPYPFKTKHIETVAQRFPKAAVELIDGRDLFWWGIRTPHALERLHAQTGALMERLSASGSI